VSKTEKDSLDKTPSNYKAARKKRLRYDTMMATAITLAASIDAGEELCYVECGDDQEQEWARDGNENSGNTSARKA